MAQKREVKSKQFVDENGIIDGSGTSGLIRSNDSKFEANIGNWVEYTDADQALPEDGAGSAAADVTLERTEFSSEILSGSGSMKITKANLADARGQGVSLNVSVDKAFRAQPLKLEFDYNTAGTFVPANPADPVTTPGDIGVYVYDVTNSKLLTPNQPYLTAGSGRYEGLVQLPDDCEEARVILHVQSESTDLYVLFVDNVKLDIASDQNVTNITDYVEWTPTSTWTTNVTHTGRYRQVGDEMEYRVEINGTGAPNAAILSIDLPPGHVIDTAKVGDTISTVPQLGFGTALDFGLSNYDIDVVYDTSTTVQITPKIASGAYTARTNGSNSVPFAFNANDRVVCTFRAPIVGLTSGTTHPASIGLNALGILRGVSGTATVTGTYSNISFTAEEDTLGGWSTDTYTVQSPGYYDITARCSVGGTYSAGNRVDGRIYNVTTATALGEDSETYPNSSAGGIGIAVGPQARGVFLKYGEQIRLQVLSNAAGPALTATQTTLSIIKIGSNAQPYAPRTCVIRDQKTSGTNGGGITTVWTARPLNTIEGDQSFLSLSTNQITLQPGTYQIEAIAPASSSADTLVASHRIKLRNITDSTDVILGQNSFVQQQAGTANAATTHSSLIGVFTITSAKTFEIQHRSGSNRSIYGFGLASSFGVDEVYAQARITKVL